MGVAREQREIDQADIGPSEQAGRHAVAGHVDRFKSRLLHEARAVGVINAGRDDHPALGQPLAQPLAHREFVLSSFHSAILCCDFHTAMDVQSPSFFFTASISLMSCSSCARNSSGP